MREQLAGILRCPRCAADGLEPRVTRRDEREAREGSLHCGCGASYPLRGGVADLCVEGRELDEARAHAWREVQQSSGLVYDDATLLGYDRAFRELPPEQAWRYPWGIHLNLDHAVRAMGCERAPLVLDVGAGICWTSLRLARAGARVVALDLLEQLYAGLASADVLMRDGDVHFERVLAPMDRLPFADRSFDHVLFHAALHHAEDLGGTLAETARVLRPGGSVWIVNEPVASLGGVFGGAFTAEMHEAGEHAHSLFAYLKALRQAGLEPRVDYAPGLGARLDALASGAALRGASSRGQALKYKLVGMVLGLWRRSPGFRRLFERRLYHLALAVFGQFLLAEARRPDTATSPSGRDFDVERAAVE